MEDKLDINIYIIVFKCIHVIVQTEGRPIRNLIIDSISQINIKSLKKYSHFRELERIIDLRL